MKHCEGLQYFDQAGIRQNIFTILREMKQHGEIFYEDHAASTTLMTRVAGAYPSDYLRIRTTMKYDKEQEQKKQNTPPTTVIHNSGTIANSAIGNTHSDLSKAFESPLSNMVSTNNEQTKKRTSSLEKLYWIAGVILAIIGILVYFKTHNN